MDCGRTVYEAGPDLLLVTLVCTCISLIVCFSLNVEIGEGRLVAVVGTVGAGKSSLLSAFRGEMEKISGHVNVTVSLSPVTTPATLLLRPSRG